MFRGVQILMFESGIGLCEDVVMMSKKSPDGKLTASIVERNCGATTDYVYFACLRPTIVGRIFGDGVKIVNGKGVSLDDLYWVGNNKIIIRKTMGFEIVSTSEKCLGVSINIE